jgi:hypothetical protein
MKKLMSILTIVAIGGNSLVYGMEKKSAEKKAKQGADISKVAKQAAETVKQATEALKKTTEDAANTLWRTVYETVKAEKDDTVILQTIMTVLKEAPYLRGFTTGSGFTSLEHRLLEKKSNEGWTPSEESSSPPASPRNWSVQEMNKKKPLDQALLLLNEIKPGVLELEKY